ncbi:MAG: ABC transporter ATP-binding protein [Bacillota bacterium]|nr:ABC transporter ATP-binding protein [Bacillota bacterium]
MPDIILTNVTKRFGKFVAVDKLNLNIRSNEFITLLGPSGCGKTTTLRMIAGLETPTEGRIMIDEDVVFDADEGINVPPNKRDVGFLFQNYALWPHMTVKQNIAFGLENLKWPKKDIEERVDELTLMLKIREFLDRYPSELSGGQQQRVAIARTLAPKPRVLFMDEPLSNLDAKLRTDMRSELKRLHKTTDSTFVYVTHDQLEAMTLSTRICIMELGKLMQYAPPLEMYQSPANLFVADFMGNPSMNFIEGKAEKTDKGVRLSSGGLSFAFTPNSALEAVPEQAVIGIRPEHVLISDEGGCPAKVYSSLPSGLETTIRLSLGEMMLTSVVFGGLDFELDSDVSFNFVPNQAILFDKGSGNALARGSLELV